MITLGNCDFCVHRHPDLSLTTCSAFPDGIPDDVLGGLVDHIDPLPGDNGIQFEPKLELPDDFKRTLLTRQAPPPQRRSS